MYRFHHVFKEVVANAAMAVPAVQKARARIGRTTSANTKDQTRHILSEFEYFMGMLGNVEGKTIVEIGPGDIIPLAPLFLRAGAKRYIAFDRFLGSVIGSYASTIYGELECDIPNFIEHVSLRRIAIEEAAPADEELADVIVSFNVLEHLRDPHQGLRNMGAMLKPDGIMVHRVDYGPHSIWSTYRNRLAFLTVPDRVWSLMGSNRGYPNRVRHVELMRTLDILGFHVSDRVTNKFTRSELNGVRKALPPRFRQHQDDDLLVLDADFACSRERVLQLGPAFPY